MGPFKKINDNLLSRIARKRLSNQNNLDKISAIHVLMEVGTIQDLETLLLNLWKEPTHEIQIEMLKAIKHLTKSLNYTKATDIIKKYLSTGNLRERMLAVELCEPFPLVTRENILLEKSKESEDDLLFLLVRVLRGSKDLDFLDRIISHSFTKDLVLRRAIYTTWFEGISNLPEDQKLYYGTKNIHTLIRATYEMNDKGTLLNWVLANADRSDLPEPKAYPEFIFRYVISLIHRWEYDPDVNRALHQLIVPAYFTFDERNDDLKEFVIV